MPQQITVATAAPSAATQQLRLTHPDFLYAMREVERYFVQFKDEHGVMPLNRAHLVVGDELRLGLLDRQRGCRVVAS